MTKEITKAYILQELQDKFKLRELIPETFRFSEEVVPTYDIEQHLTREEIKENTVSITATGGKWFFNVPATQRWELHRYNVVFMTGSYKVAGLMVCRPLLANYMYLDLTKNQTVSYAKNLPQPVILQPGDGLYINIDDFTSIGNLMLRADVTVEEIR
jgi:hypothetical protein